MSACHWPRWNASAYAAAISYCEVGTGRAQHSVCHEIAEVSFGGADKGALTLKPHSRVANDLSMDGVYLLVVPVYDFEHARVLGDSGGMGRFKQAICQAYPGGVKHHVYTP